MCGFVGCKGEAVAGKKAGGRPQRALAWAAPVGEAGHWAQNPPWGPVSSHCTRMRPPGRTEQGQTHRTGRRGTSRVLTGDRPCPSCQAFLGGCCEPPKKSLGTCSGPPPRPSTEEQPVVMGRGPAGPDPEVTLLPLTSRAVVPCRRRGQLPRGRAVRPQSTLEGAPRLLHTLPSLC